MQHNTQPNDDAQIGRDARLPNEIHPPTPATRQPATQALITGATGFLGRYVVKALLQQTELQLTCLIRADSTVEARKRLNNALEQIGLADCFDPKIQARIRVVCGDITQAQFSLNSANYEQLAQSIDTIYHCAALVNWARSYRKLRRINVMGTLEVIRFACHLRSKPLLFVSSMAVCYATDRKDQVDEQTDMLPHIAHMPLGYAQSKCVAESLLRQAAWRGLPVTILRPALISGATDSGLSNTGDFVAALLEGCVRTGIAMDEDWLLDFVPADFVAEVIANLPLGQTEQQTGCESQLTTLHLVADRPRYWRELILWLNLYGYPIKLISPGRWLVQALKNREHCGDRLYNYRRFFQGLPGQPQQAKPYECYLQSGQQRIDSHVSATLLKNIGLETPTLDAGLLERYLDYFQQAGLLPKLYSQLSAHRNKTPDQQTLLNIFKLSPIELQSIPLNTDNGILNQIAAAYAGAAVGLRAYRVINTTVNTARDIVVKTKCADKLVESSTLQMAELCHPKLGGLFARFRTQLGLTGSQHREAALYQLSDPLLRRYTPRCFGTHHDEESELATIVLEKLPATTRIDSWDAQQILTVIEGLAHIQSMDSNSLKPLLESGLLVQERSMANMLEMVPLWHELAQFASRQDEAAAKLLAMQTHYIADLPGWWPELFELPQSLVHGDFNPRNLILRPSGSAHKQAGQLCVFDWELAAIGLPQRDLAEFLCFALSVRTRDPSIVDGWIEQHRQRYNALRRTSTSTADWQQGFTLALQQFVITRLPMYALMHRFRPQAFFSVLNENALWLLKTGVTISATKMAL